VPAAKISISDEGLDIPVAVRWNGTEHGLFQDAPASRNGFRLTDSVGGRRSRVNGAFDGGLTGATVRPNLETQSPYSFPNRRTHCTKKLGLAGGLSPVEFLNATCVRSSMFLM
jgi:hypothetical protein